jgi:hypothetical protein
MNHPRRGNDAVLLLDGRVLAAGGETISTDVLDSAEVYDPASQTWTDVDQMGDRRVYSVVVLLADGRVLVAGGYGLRDELLTSAEIFDPATNTFSDIAPMNVARARFQGARLDDGRVVVMGGNGVSGANDTAEIYDPATGAWTMTGAMQEGRIAPRAVKLPDGRVLITGGTDAGADGGRSTDTSEIFEICPRCDPAQGTFNAIKPMTVARDRHAIMLLGDGRVLVAGGRSDSQVIGDTDVLIPANGTWTSTDPWTTAALRRHTSPSPTGTALSAVDSMATATCATASFMTRLRTPGAKPAS